MTCNVLVWDKASFNFEVMLYGDAEISAEKPNLCTVLFAFYIIVLDVM